MRIYVCPVSGGAFPLQLGLLAECGLAGVRPDIVMGSSGGNVAAYIGLAADWQAATIPTIATQVNTTMFAQSWWPRYLNFFPSLWLARTWVRFMLVVPVPSICLRITSAQITSWRLKCGLAP